MKSDKNKKMDTGHHADDFSKKDQPVGKVREDKPQGATISGLTESKGMGGTGGRLEEDDKKRPTDALGTDKRREENRGTTGTDIRSTDTSSKAGFRRNDDKDEDIRGASTSGIPGQGI